MRMIVVSDKDYFNYRDLEGKIDKVINELKVSGNLRENEKVEFVCHDIKGANALSDLYAMNHNMPVYRIPKRRTYGR